MKPCSVNLIYCTECKSYGSWSCRGWCDLCVQCRWSLVCFRGGHAARCCWASWIWQLVSM